MIHEAKCFICGKQKQLTIKQSIGSSVKEICAPCALTIEKNKQKSIQHGKEKRSIRAGRQLNI